MIKDKPELNEYLLETVLSPLLSEQSRVFRLFLFGIEYLEVALQFTSVGGTHSHCALDSSSVKRITYRVIVSLAYGLT